MKIQYSESFQKYVKECLATGSFVGTGNPNAKILLIGKEAAIASENINGQNWYNSNAEDWQKHISAGTGERLAYPIDADHELRRAWGRNTWSKYQKLVDQTFERQAKKFNVNFLEEAFTTEMNDSPGKRTSKTSKKRLGERKSLFQKMSFFRDFPVVILACSNYIQNHGKVREIDDIFQAHFDGHDLDAYHYSRGNWFYTHHNEDRSRLVIHTRQLSANVNNALLHDMGKLVRQHLAACRRTENRNITLDEQVKKQRLPMKFLKYYPK